jgi:DNA-binding CsgD family transcriptional regulator
MSNLKHTPEFDLAFRFATETNQNIFLTGKAGTGKTTFLKYLLQHCHKKTVVAAPTGVAAINAGGVTLHSLFQLPFTPFIPSTSPFEKKDIESSTHFEDENTPHAPPVPEKHHSLLSKIHFNQTKLDLFRSLELLIIDEASMVACHTVDAIDTLLKGVRRKPHLPFGGVQVLFIGDLHQLQPVTTRDEWSILKNYYPSIFFFDSRILKQNVPVMIELKEIFRQRDNAFVDILNGIRHNNISEQHFNRLKSCMRPGFIPSESEEYVTLTTHNLQADRINEWKLNRLKAGAISYKAKISGEFPEYLYPVELNLKLKVGAQVMFTKNDLEEKRYYNGKTGIVSHLDEDTIRVKCKDEPDITVKKDEWKNVSYSLNAKTKEITEEELGTFQQYPLRLAWAITIHKSQGLTFEKVIIDAANAFANGQVYVALSRCTSLEGLVLTTPVNQNYLGAHVQLLNWTQKNQDDKSLTSRFEEARLKFIREELNAIFSWPGLYYALRDLEETLKENTEHIPTSNFEWTKQFMQKQVELSKVAAKFKEQIEKLCKDNPLVESNQPLQQRIKDAANYFYSEFSNWKQSLQHHPFSTDVKKASRQIDAALNKMNTLLHEILFHFSYCKNGFILNNYYQHGKKPPELKELLPTSYEQGQQSKEPVETGNTSHTALYNALNDMRKKIGKETGLPLYMIFSNQVMKNICDALPGNRQALLNVNGFGKVKVNRYGDDVLEAIRDYCDEHNIEPKEVIEKKRERKKKKTESAANKIDTAEESYQLFRQGKTVKEIAGLRNLTESTIEGHLSKAIRKGEVKIEELMALEEAQRIAKYFPPAIFEAKLGAVKAKVPADITYGKLNLVMAWIQWKERDE